MNVSITATGKDRPGIIAALSGALLEAKGNVEDASMTILEGEFAMIFLAQLKTETAFTALEKNLKATAKKYGLWIDVKKVSRRLVRGEKHKQGTDPWVVSALGKDRAGIVHHICLALSQLKLNITDLNSKIMGKGTKTAYALILEVDVPKKPKLVTALRRKLEALEKKLRISITVKPLDAACL